MVGRILTLSGTIPGEPGVGGVILDDLRAQLCPGTLQFFPCVTQQAVDLGWLDRPGEPLAGHVVRRYETGWQPVKGVAGEAVGWLARRSLFDRHCRKIVGRICTSPVARTCDRIWAILNCPTVIHIALMVAERLRKPLITLVWDAPELLVDKLNIDRWSASAMMKQFGNTLRASVGVGVICEQMERAYRDRYGANRYVILRHGIQEHLWAEPQTLNEGPIRIGFAGSITASEPFRRLVQTLDRMEWRVGARKIVLRLIGARYLLDSRQPQHVEYFGWRSLSETVELLSECTFCYLPQPFAERLRPLSELSFPTKLTTYLAAGQRVLLHAPEFASVVPFVEQYPVGIVCHSLEVSSIQAALQELVKPENQGMGDSIQRARDSELSSEVFMNRFRTLAELPSAGVMSPSVSAPVEHKN